ncbi:MAG: methylmalonyl Co-A mutase-associated GTPase MeaB [Myxococcota bacterium]
MARSSPTLDELVRGVLAGERRLLARAITLVESERAADEPKAAELLNRTAGAGASYRLGVSGTPGVGKSTFLERFGLRRTAQMRRVAVLAIDPSSRQSGGSILGDKTRMAQLSRDERAFIRPSPAGRTLGGIARKSYEAVLLCDAAGFDDVFVETVGVGQNETLVADIVDETLLLLQPRSGDGLQGIKRGILEAADVVVIHKADGPLKEAAETARVQLASALRLMRGAPVPVLTCSSLTGDGLDELEALLNERRTNQALEERRREQAVRWMWRLAEERLLAWLRGEASDLEASVRSGESPRGAAAELVARALKRAEEP